MNSASLSLLVLSSNLVQTQYPNSICAIANCLFTQVAESNNTYEFPIQVRAWGADANNLAALQRNETILALGSLWHNQENNSWWIESHSLIIGYRGMMINHLDVVGRVGQEPDINYFESGNSVCRTSLALNRNKNETTWISIQAWKKQAETLKNYGRKGDYLGASGRLEINQWIDKSTGEIRQSLKLNSRIKLLSRKPDEEAIAA